MAKPHPVKTAKRVICHDDRRAISGSLGKVTAHQIKAEAVTLGQNLPKAAALGDVFLRALGPLDQLARPVAVSGSRTRARPPRLRTLGA